MSVNRAFRFGALAVCLAAVPVAAAKRAGDDCAPLKGNWERTVPQVDHWGETDTAVNITPPLASITTKRRPYEESGTYSVSVRVANIACVKTGDDAYELTFSPSDPSAPERWTMDISHVTPDSFVTMEFEPPPHPPPENWKGAEWAIVWKRIAP